MLQSLPFLLAYIYPLLVLLTARGNLFLLVVPLVTFLVLPLLDFAFGLNPFNPSPEDENKLRDVLSFRLITWLWLPFQIALTIFGMLYVLTPERNVSQIIGMTFAVGITNGAISITFAHELCHKKNQFEQLLAEAMLIGVSYMHFAVEHIHGHHRHVGTPKDPATARFGESFYRFYPRTVLGSYFSAWGIENNRLAKLRNASKKPNFLSLENRMIRYTILQLLLNGAILYLCGWGGLLFFLAQGFLAFSSLEIINYVEHYGLSRKEIAPGVYEKTLPKHSWNSGQRVSNWILINLARHSDHHFVASKRYQLLQSDLQLSPQLPFGYGTMYLIALLPPLWFKTVDPLVRQWQQSGGKSAELSAEQEVSA